MMDRDPAYPLIDNSKESQMNHTVSEEPKKSSAPLRPGNDVSMGPGQSVPHVQMNVKVTDAK